MDAWVATIREKAADTYKFQAECTPGYYNNESKPRTQNESYGDGPPAFHELLRVWRDSGGMDEVLIGCRERQGSAPRDFAGGRTVSAAHQSPTYPGSMCQRSHAA